METDHGRTQFLEQPCHLTIERETPWATQNRGRVNAELPVIGRQPSPPSCFTPGIRRGWRMTEEVEIERPVCSRANRSGLSPHPISVEHRARNRAKPTRSRDRNSKRVPLRTSHRRLHNRKLDTQDRLEDLGIPPHPK